LSAGGHGIGTHLRSEGMGRIHHMGDRLLPQIIRQPSTPPNRPPAPAGAGRWRPCVRHRRRRCPPPPGQSMAMALASLVPPSSRTRGMVEAWRRLGCRSSVSARIGHRPCPRKPRGAGRGHPCVWRAASPGSGRAGG
jgi:hypothetical protein